MIGPTKELASHDDRNARARRRGEPDPPLVEDACPVEPPAARAIIAVLAPSQPTPYRVPLVVDVTISAVAHTAVVCAWAARAVLGVVRPVAEQVLRPSAINSDYWPETRLRSFAERGRQARSEAGHRLGLVADDLLPAVVDAALDRLDLTEIVLERVDILRILASIDSAAIADKIDIDAIVSELDFNALVLQVIHDIDLPAIIRDSSGAMASESVTGMRIRSIEADERVNRIVDRLLLRRGDRTATTAGPDAESVPEK